MNTIKKSLLLLVLMSINSSVIYTQEKNTILSEKLKQDMKELNETLEKLEKSRRRTKNILTVLYSLQTGLGLLTLYVSYYLHKQPPQPLSPLARRDAEFAAVEAHTERPVGSGSIAMTGAVITAAGLWSLYHNLDLSDQVKKLLKLLKKESNPSQQK